MATKLLIKQNGQISELSASQNAVAVNANARTHFQLVDDAGNLVRHYNSRMVGDKLLIDLPDTAGSPDFIINNYTTYFGSFPVGNTGTFGASDAAASVVSTHVPAPASVAPSVAETAVETSAPVKASTVSSSSSSGFPTWGAIGLGVLGVAGIAAAAGGGGGGSDSGSSNTSSSGSNDLNTIVNSTSNQPVNRPQLSTTTYQEDVLHGNKIVLPTAYTKTVLHGKDTAAITKAATGGMDLNQYIHSDDDKKIKITDLNNLSREVQTELSLFVANLLNPIREQWGVGLFKVTNGAMNFAQDVANEYTQNGKSIFNGGHYVEGITRAAAKYGLSTKSNYYEDLGGVKIIDANDKPVANAFQNLTLDDLKEHVYNSILEMLFNDAHVAHAHAKSLLNRMDYEDQNAAIDYLGVDTSNALPGELNMHIIKATDNSAYITDDAKFSQTILTNEIVASKSSSTPAAYELLDTDNSHLATDNLVESDDVAEPQITQKFVFSKLLDVGIRQLSDEYDAEDVLVLDNSVFTALSEDKSNLTQHIHYETTTGELSYDADGEGSEPAVVIAQLPAGLQENQLNFEVI